MSDSNWLCFSDLTLDFEYPYFIFFFRLKTVLKRLSLNDFVIRYSSEL